ncbi:MAG TPA: baseplate J/gp47 family protein, partial [Ktedonobacterales bacterium]|nr:baseplate J/gp47 family protein [Ktedonobacterales bacterium]
MIDPGHPFSVNYADIIAALEDRVRNGVEQPDQRTFIYKSTITSYELPAAAFAITRVTGLVNGQFHLFDPGVDYTFNANRVVWINPALQPDDGSRLDVEYTFREVPPGITDFNPGSVVGSLIRAVAREMKLIYEQMDQAYRRAFIDQATGAALDNVVALLGVTRKTPVAATGTVTFFRKTPPPRTIQIPARTRLADQTGNTFLTSADGTIPPAAPIDEITQQAQGSMKTSKVIVELVGVWKAADDPTSTPPLAVKPGFGGDGQTITLDLPPAILNTLGDLRIRYKPASTDIPIVAEQPGAAGNVAPASIVIMPTPPPGVDGVTNALPTQIGEDAENDDPLRERAKHALERAGNATSNAIKFAVLEVKGVEGVEVIDRSIDDAIPLG